MTKEYISRSLLYALTADRPALSQPAVTALLHFIARECHWRIDSFDWRQIHRTYHECKVQKEGDGFSVFVGADAPILAMARVSADGEKKYFDDPAVLTAATGYYAQTLEVLPAAELLSDLSDDERAWLRGFSKRMAYDLNYWNPQTVGDVVFNHWD
jgi:hypothetical protein